MKVTYLMFKLIFLLFCFSFLGIEAPAESFDLPAPRQTDLIERDINRSQEGVLSGVFRYTSRLSRDEILNFYRHNFLSQGFSEKRSDSPNVFAFEADHKSRTLMLTSFPEDTTNYSITFYEVSRELVKKLESHEEGNMLQRMRPRHPKSLDFMPLYPRISAQLEHIDWEYASMISVGYLSGSDSRSVIDFYRNSMSGFGWRLEERKDSDGTYSVGQWAFMVAPFTSFCADCPGDVLLPVEVPPLRLRGAKLTFRRRQQKCVITVYTFDDIFEKARGTVYEEGVKNLLGRHGATVIGVAYFY